MEEQKFRDLFKTEEWILNKLKKAKYQVLLGYCSDEVIAAILESARGKSDNWRL